MHWNLGRPNREERRRQAKEQRRASRDHGHPVRPGSGVVSASMDEVIAAMRAVDADLRWEDLRGRLLPVFRRRRPFPEMGPPPLYLERPPGIEVGIGVDIGPAFMFVSGHLLDGWGVTADQALDLAIENVRERANTKRLDPIVEGSIGGVTTRLFQSGQSIGSPLILLPEEIGKRFGDAPQYILAPMRDLLVSVPQSAGSAFAHYLYESIAEEDPNCLDLPVFAFEDGRLEIALPLDEEVPVGPVH